MGGAAVHVDVQAVRFVMNHIGLRPEHLEHGLRDAAGRAVGAVQAHPVAAEGMDGGGGQIADILISPLDVVRDPADPVVSGRRDLHLSVQIFLHLFQNGLLHFEAFAVNDLDPVVVKGIMARRDHDAEIKVPAFRHIGHAGRSGHMQQIYIRPAPAQPRRQRIFKHIAGTSGILSDHARRLFRGPFRKIPAQKLADPECVIRRQRLVCLASETVCSEIFHIRLHSAARCGRCFASLSVFLYLNTHFNASAPLLQAGKRPPPRQKPRKRTPLSGC